MDYRKIPREYLNARIPKGRGMVKWQAAQQGKFEVKHSIEVFAIAAGMGGQDHLRGGIL